MGIDIDVLLTSAQSMADACRVADPRRNPGVALGAMLAAGADRIVVEIAFGESASPRSDARRDLPCVSLAYDGLGAEFFCWEIATATAGFLLGVNPFDEPNVQQAKYGRCRDSRTHWGCSKWPRRSATFRRWTGWDAVRSTCTFLAEIPRSCNELRDCCSAKADP